MRKLQEKELTKTQAILIYVALGCGPRIREFVKSDCDCELRTIAEKVINYRDIHDSMDKLYTIFSKDEIEFVRNALKGEKFGDYESGLVAGIFGYCLF